MSAPRPSPGSAPNAVTSSRRSSTAADDHRPAARVGDARREHQSDRPRAEDRHGVARGNARTLDTAQAAGERLEQRSHLRRESGGNVVEVHRRDPLGHHDPVRIRAGEELQLEALLASRATVAAATRSGVGRHHPAPVDEPAELVPEGRRRLAQEDRMAAAVRLQIRAVGQCELDLHEHLAWPRLRPRHVLDAQVTRRVEPRRLHGVNTTFSAAPLR